MVVVLFWPSHTTDWRVAVYLPIQLTGGLWWVSVVCMGNWIARLFGGGESEEPLMGNLFVRQDAICSVSDAWSCSMLWPAVVFLFARCTGSWGALSGC